MARSIKSLESLPIELQVSILDEFSLSMGSENIEIDGKTYTVHKDVVGLIDNLISQLESMRLAISKYKR